MSTTSHINTSTLVILAAGQGSRFGGAKQFAQFGAKQKTLMEYNIIQAVKAGINHVVFITQASQQASLEQQVIPHLPKGVKTSIALQDMNNLPAKCAVEASRVKPLGTAHALWCAKQYLQQGFIVINADDYYGEQAFRKIQHIAPANCGLVAFELGKTLSTHGGVNRGFCQHSQSKLVDIKEVIDIIEIDANHCRGMCDGSAIVMSKAQLVSMNFWRLTPAIFQQIEALLQQHFPTTQEHANADLNKEVYLPDAVFALIAATQANVELLASQDAWFGVTYAADSPSVESAITSLSNNGAFDSHS
ncbi:sugar phosphate nucleotidyltransferase [Thalassotalea sediminis]|uniref:sugar phosphate nucleotidyltransferase n=1 Tax=Thalassotalea sediminis TaxID=1759089 RepID=UPI002573093D|nr:sugar phosphate nucleotidyltransferase [Thalassotalea sediminis]